MRRFAPLLLALACATADDPVTDEVVVDTADTGEVSDEPDVDVVRACILEDWFRTNCTGCHFGGNHLDLRSRPLEQLTEKDREEDPGTPIVDPGNADSILVRKLLANPGLVTLDEETEGLPMPADSMITEAEAERVRDWVVSGAPLCD